MKQSAAARFEQVKEHYLAALARKEPVRDIDELPVSYELIGDEWLTQALCTKVPGAAVLSHTLGASDEGTSNRRRIALRYNDIGRLAGLPDTVFCKATQSLQSRFVLGLNRSTESESIFYNQLRPLLEIEAPVGLFAKVDTLSLNSILIMEDISSRVTFCDHRTPVSLQRAQSQIDLLARFHGTFYGKPKMQQLIEPLLDFSEWCELTQDAIDWSAARLNGFMAGKEVIPQRLYARADEVEQATLWAINSHDQLPQTLIHNDVHLKNWYVTADGVMGLADWQICTRGCGVRDLVYTIATSLSIEDRRAWEVELIHRYLDRLSAECDAPLDFDETLQIYRQQLLCALANWTATLVPPPGSPDMQPAEASVEFIKRITQAMDDWEVLESF